MIDSNSTNNRIISNYITDNETYGVHILDSSSAIIQDCVISNNKSDGILSEEDSSLVLKYNNITDNMGYGVRNTDPEVIINAQNNWWGDPNGPSGVGHGKGSKVSIGVDYDNWLDHEISMPAEGKRLLTGIYSAFDFNYDVVSLWIRVVDEAYSETIYEIEIFRADQYPKWDNIEVLRVPEGWYYEDFGCGVRFYTKTNPLLKCQPLYFEFSVEAERISWFMRINVTDKDHYNIGTIVSTRWRLYHYYLV